MPLNTDPLTNRNQTYTVGNALVESRMYVV